MTQVVDSMIAIRGMSRRELSDAWRTTPDYRPLIKLAARCDVVWFIDRMCWTVDPRRSGRHGKTKTIPAVIWPQTSRLARFLDGSIRNRTDGLVHKGRDLLATWTTMNVIAHHFVFDADYTCLLLAQRERDVDAKGDIQTNMERLRFILRMVERYFPGLTGWDEQQHSKYLHLTNPASNAQIRGAAMTGNAPTQGRYTMIYYDELALLRDALQRQVWTYGADAADCRIGTSTPRGAGNLYGQMLLSGSVPICRLHWLGDPRKARGAYCNLHTRELSSPWRDAEIKRRTATDAHMTARAVAQEIDGDIIASGATVWDATSLKTCRAGQVRRPVWTGTVHVHADGTPSADDLRQRNDGELHIFEAPVEGVGYLLFADSAICLDDESDQDALAVVRHDTSAIVATMVGRWSIPHWAWVICAVGDYYGKAMLAIEANQCGTAVLGTILGRVGVIDDSDDNRNAMYPTTRIWRRQRINRTTMKREKIYGWDTSNESKRAMVASVDKALEDGWFQCPDRRFYDQADRFCNLTSGKIGADGGYDDLCIAVAGSVHLHREAASCIILPDDLQTQNDGILRYDLDPNELYDDLVSQDWDDAAAGFDREVAHA